MRTGVHEGDDDTETGLSVVRLVVLRDRGANTEDEQEHNVGSGAVEENRTTAEPGSQSPGEDVGHELETGGNEVELEGSVGWNTSLYA